MTSNDLIVIATTLPFLSFGVLYWLKAYGVGLWKFLLAATVNVLAFIVSINLLIATGYFKPKLPALGMIVIGCGFMGASFMRILITLEVANRNSPNK